MRMQDYLVCMTRKFCPLWLRSLALQNLVFAPRSSSARAFLEPLMWNSMLHTVEIMGDSVIGVRLGLCVLLWSCSQSVIWIVPERLMLRRPNRYQQYTPGLQPSPETKSEEIFLRSSHQFSITGNVSGSPSQVTVHDGPFLPATQYNINFGDTMLVEASFARYADPKLWWDSKATPFLLWMSPYSLVRLNGCRWPFRWGFTVACWKASHSVESGRDSKSPNPGSLSITRVH